MIVVRPLSPVVPNTWSFDFETKSEAGYIWNLASQKYEVPNGARFKGLKGIGSFAYAEHYSTDVLCMSYGPHGVTPRRRWRPGDPPPQDLFDHLAAGGLVVAHNAMFERAIWHYQCRRRYGWPELPFHQMRCSMATARVNSLPGKLEMLAEVLGGPDKDPEGKRLLKKFSIPRDPTKKDARHWIEPEHEPDEFEKLLRYCDSDVDAEDGATDRMSPMTDAELLFWWVDQEINWRGLGTDTAGVTACIGILRQALARYGEECKRITGLEATQLQALRGWLAGRGCVLPTMDAETVDGALEPRAVPLPPDVRRVLEIRQLIGSASVKKLFAMQLQASSDGRLRNLIVHHGARTGRPTGEGAQPLNMPRGGPAVRWCAACSHPHRPDRDVCPWCCEPGTGPVKKWSVAAVDYALEIMALGSLDLVEYYFGSAVDVIIGCLRGLFQAAPGYDLIASDYSAIEAVVIAMLAGEQWRIDAFRKREPIYLLSAAKITGRTLQFYLDYKAQHGEDHEDRQRIGKVAELAGGFGGWIGAWLAFGATDPEPELRKQILAWRDASPAIVEYWGGQFRGRPWDRDRRPELYGVEGHAIRAIRYPGKVFSFRGIDFQVRITPAGTPALYIKLLSGRELTYHDAILTPSYRREGEETIVYYTWNSNPKYGALGWGAMETFGGRLTENIVQATAHDILRHGIMNLRAAGYPTVLHVYDEIVCEVPSGSGSVEEVERLMSTLPAWAEGWPVYAAGGWRGRRYRKG